MSDPVDNVSSDRGEDVPMSDRLFSSLSQDIISGRLPPGMRMTEPELAKRFGVSRAPLREAIRRLEERQLVERIPFCGARVLVLSQTMLVELYEIREALEALACRRAARVITEEQVAQLRSTLAEDEEALKANEAGDCREFTAIRDIHTQIAVIAGNGELIRLLSREIWLYIRADFRRRIRTRESMWSQHRSHIQILDALAAHDGELAELLMRRHIAVSRERLERSLS
jgi:DNA-binding GntR family transcriptional regulator